MRKIRTDGQATRDAILAVAEVEFSEQGFELASVRAICSFVSRQSEAKAGSAANASK